MKLHIQRLVVRTRETVEEVRFSDVTFIHGPVSTGKSTIARLIDYCLGGYLERTPAIQSEFISAELYLVIGSSDCSIERATTDQSHARVSWVGRDGSMESINAPFNPSDDPLLENAEVYNFSDLIFHLGETTPIRVRQRMRDPDSPLIRLSIRDVLWYCYLDQAHLDSSFLRLEDTFRGRKSQDAMRFFTGLHSEALNEIESELNRALDAQRGKREAVHQIRTFMERFKLDSDGEIAERLAETQRQLDEARVLQERAQQQRTA